MNHSQTSGSDRIKRIKNPFTQHRVAAEDAGVHTEGRLANVVDAGPVDIDATTTPNKQAPILKERKYKHLTPEMKNAIVNSMLRGNSYRTTGKVFGVSPGVISSPIRKSRREHNS